LWILAARFTLQLVRSLGLAWKTHTPHGQYVAKTEAACSGLYPLRSYSFVVPGSRCPGPFCTSLIWGAVLERRGKMKVARIERAE